MEVAGLKWDAIDFENNTITIKHTLVQVSIKGQRTKDKQQEKTKRKIKQLQDTPSSSRSNGNFKKV